MKIDLRLPSLVLILGLWAGPASAQSPYGQPRTSPYLNLLRGGTSPGINYFGLVRPELEFRSSIGQLRQQTQVNQQAITGLQNTQAGPLTTGHQVGFMTHTSYFQNLGGGQAGFMTTGSAAPRGAQGGAAAQPAGGGGKRGR